MELISASTDAKPSASVYSQCVLKVKPNSCAEPKKTTEGVGIGLKVDGIEKANESVEEMG